MVEKPKLTRTTFIVSRYDPPHWHTLLATTDKAEAEAMLTTLGKAGRIEIFAPQKKRR